MSPANSLAPPSTIAETGSTTRHRAWCSLSSEPPVARASPAPCRSPTPRTSGAGPNDETPEPDVHRGEVPHDRFAGFVEAHEQRALSPVARRFGEGSRERGLGRAGSAGDERGCAPQVPPVEHRVQPRDAARDLLEKILCFISSVARGATTSRPDANKTIGISFEESATPRHLRTRSLRIAVRPTTRCCRTTTAIRQEGKERVPGRHASSSAASWR